MFKPKKLQEKNAPSEAISSSFWGLPYRILNINHKKELLRGLWVKQVLGFRDSRRVILGLRAMGSCRFLLDKTMAVISLSMTIVRVMRFLGWMQRMPGIQRASHTAVIYSLGVCRGFQSRSRLLLASSEP